MNRWKQIAVALTVVVSVLSGCSLGPQRKPPQQLANIPPPAAVPSSSSTDVTCCPSPEDASGARDLCLPGMESHRYQRGISGYSITSGNGSAWFRSDTREYCVEEGTSIHFPNGDIVEGPKRGKY